MTEGGGAESLCTGVANRADKTEEEGGGGGRGTGDESAPSARRLLLQQLLEVRHRCFRRASPPPVSVSLKLMTALFLTKKGQRGKKGHLESLENQFPDLL